MTVDKDSSNLFRRGQYDEDYWDTYLAMRPHYDESFYQKIYEYHKLNGGLTETAHDVGTGPGQVAAEICRHFKGVVASDNNATHLAVARHRLDSTSIPSRNVSLVECSAETLDEVYPAASVDLITAAECLPLIDPDRAMKGFARLLKPNGTLAIWFYGRPVFAEPDEVIKGGGPQHVTGWKRATDCMASFLDNIELDEQVWQHVVRRKWNSQYAMPFYNLSTCDFEITTSSRIGKEETVIESDEPEFWQQHWSIGDFKKFVKITMPT